MAILRSIAAVVVGIVVYSALLIGATWAGDALLVRHESALINYNVVTQLLWLIWNIVSMVPAGYSAGAIAPRAATGHGVVMGAIQALFTLGALFTSHRDI